MNKALYIYTDGGSRGNPGESAIGVYVENEHGRQLLSGGEPIGIATNNIAEYKAILFAITWLCKNKKLLDKDTKIYFFMDSQLAYSQLTGLYKIKNAALKNLLFKIREKEAELGLVVSYAYISREKNKKADSLVNMALNKAKSL
ncbi:MAG: hypothetical protein A3F31_02775 [Candidatus Levybacteria bacterium RIFCSPHIGHO2_12_FULL_38_12]|nr:MAG: hypothetical protein A2770_00975 [Candidatus Levybacteria bacterium RIFCSPHIGHO2_01_FULL_38_12]OGH22316.1 MAG: hypothetical protein A3D75_01990 [Candidatus Levybacteria bacterium RIFCSPHIGHO2_02_FULL_37_18]OGH22482.1 MAG: hypothetical protein A3F31_02775 [Candidatus Levybacteria bacterium RIFCSPHIGHO2_12_FULL_38_12]OGH33773.1 MAG: hypothetical protein A3A47_01230 [Candidatus Levybacteria bacterium RIFCSPLOWO2_01_FULL_37_20]OGH43473.1 MAG: hypothetical protein A3J14_01440 [Candidatus Lev